MEKTNLSIQTIRKTDFQIAKEILKPDILVSSGIKELDRLIGGFKTGEITYIDGDSDLISNLPNQLCVNTYRTFDKDIIYIDGGMRADPYKIAKYARKMELDQKKTLKHVHISRAFTVYQLSTLIQDLLEPTIKRHNPQAIIIGCFPVFFLDSDVSEKEAQTILRSCLHKLRELTTKYNLISVFTSLDKKLVTGNRNVRGIIYENVDEVVLMKELDLATRVNLLKKKMSTLILHLAKGQMRLQEFGMVI